MAAGQEVSWQVTLKPREEPLRSQPPGPERGPQESGRWQSSCEPEMRANLIYEHGFIHPASFWSPLFLQLLVFTRVLFQNPTLPQPF